MYLVTHYFGLTEFMRIFNLMLSRDLGGIQQAYIDYYEALRNQGHEIINVTSRGAKINNLLPGDIVLPTFTTWCIISKIYLRIMLMKYKPNIIISHGGTAIKFAYAAKLRDTKLIGVAHNYTYKRLKKCDYVIVITEHLRKYMQSNGYASTKIFKIPNMLRITKNYKKKNFHEQVVIGSYGRFVEQKGYKYLLEAASILKTKNYNFKLVIAGNGPGEAKLKSEAARLTISDRVEFIGWVDDKDKFFEEIDIFCLPSIHEPFGIVLLEAMERSTPIVSTRCEGPSEIFSDKKDALLVDIKSSADIADKIAKYIDNPDMAQTSSESAYDNLLKNYNIKIVAKKLSKIISLQ